MILKAILKGILGALVYLGAVLIMFVGGCLAMETYLWVDELQDMPDDILPFVSGAFVLALFLMVFAYVYGRFVIIPYEGGGQE